MRISTISGLLLSLVAAACAAPDKPAGTVESEEIGAAEAAVKLSDIDAVPAYFDHGNRYTVSDDPSWIYARFNAHVGKDVNVDVQKAPGAKEEGELCGGFAGFKCAEGLYCAYEPEASCGAGDQAGTCAKRPEVCNHIYDPVCGCDGKTYGNACSAALSGVSVAHEGECAPPIANVGESCGGFRMGPAPVCAEGLYCSYAPGDSCGWADAPGTCAQKPEACTKNYAPVCGCDGQTYGNACSAGMNGVAVLHDGVC